jgi:hypothetical protein
MWKASVLVEANRKRLTLKDISLLLTMEFITTIKSFMIKAPRANYIMKFRTKYTNSCKVDRLSAIEKILSNSEVV